MSWGGRHQGPATDPSYYASALSSFQTAFNVTTTPIRPLPQYSWAESLYDAPLEMRYSDLDPHARYQLKVVWGYDVLSARIRLIANHGQYVVHDYMPKGQPVTFDLPSFVTASGQLYLSWNQEPGSGDNGRGCQVAEVFLLRLSTTPGEP
jgi:hypothetical protein